MVGGIAATLSGIYGGSSLADILLLEHGLCYTIVGRKTLELGQRFLIVKVWVHMLYHVRTRLQTNAMQSIGKTTTMSKYNKEGTECIQYQALF